MSRALEGVSGVIKATASYATQQATVRAKGRPCTSAGHTGLITALRKVGYDGKVVAQKWLQSLQPGERLWSTGSFSSQ